MCHNNWYVRGFNRVRVFSQRAMGHMECFCVFICSRFGLEWVHMVHLGLAPFRQHFPVLWASQASHKVQLARRFCQISAALEIQQTHCCMEKWQNGTMRTFTADDPAIRPEPINRCNSGVAPSCDCRGSADDSFCESRRTFFFCSTDSCVCEQRAVPVLQITSYFHVHSLQNCILGCEHYFVVYTYHIVPIWGHILPTGAHIVSPVPASYLPLAHIVPIWAQFVLTCTHIILT